jgi:transposase-like protein
MRDILTHMHIRSYDDFKAAITEEVASQGMTRSGLARQLEAAGLLRAHTVRCLLGSPARSSVAASHRSTPC